MKKPAFYSLTLIAGIFLNSFTTGIHAQTSKAVAISVSGIEYDDPNFTLLRETLKKNTRVKQVKSSYEAGTAQLAFTCNGDAAELWDEIPKTVKQLFKVTSIGGDLIKLDYSKVQSNSSGTDKTVQKNNGNKKDCFDCDYFPMCTYDLTKSYGGRIFHGIREDDNSIEYYYCSNGELIKRWDYTKKVTRKEFTAGLWDDYITTYEDYENKTASLTILKSNVPVGTTWTESISDGGSQYIFTLEAKGIKLIDDGKTYNDVIKVMAYTQGSGHKDYHYYAKGVGYVGKNLVDEVMKQRDVAAKIWNGVWKLKEDNGKSISPDETTEYLSIDKEGRADLFYYVTKKSTGKLYRVSPNTIPGYDAISGWSLSDNQTGSVLYLKFKYASGESLDMSRKSVPQKNMTIGTKTYEYLGEKFNFNEL